MGVDTQLVTHSLLRYMLCTARDPQPYDPRAHGSSGVCAAHLHQRRQLVAAHQARADAHEERAERQPDHGGAHDLRHRGARRCPRRCDGGRHAAAEEEAHVLQAAVQGFRY